MQVSHVRQLLHHLLMLNLLFMLQVSVMLPCGSNVPIIAYLFHPPDFLQKLICFAVKLPLMLQHLVSGCFSFVLMIPTSLAGSLQGSPLGKRSLKAKRWCLFFCLSGGKEILTHLEYLRSLLEHPQRMFPIQLWCKKRHWRGGRGVTSLPSFAYHLYHHTISNNLCFVAFQGHVKINPVGCTGTSEKHFDCTL